MPEHPALQRVPNRVRVYGIVLSLLLPSAAFAQQASIRLELEPSAASHLDVEATVESLTRELDAPVVREGDARVTIAAHMLEGSRIEIVFIGPDERRARTVDLPSDRAEATRIVVLIAANLARDQIADLLSSSGPSAELAAPETPSAVLAAPAAPAVREPPVAPPASRVRVQPLDDRPFAVRRPLHLGLAIGGGAAPVDDRAEGFFDFGLGLSYQVDPHVAIGVTQFSIGLGFSSVESFLFALHMTPFVELSGFLDRHVQAYARVGLLVEGRSETALSEGWFQTAPYAGGGVRFWITDWFSLGIEIGVHLVVTNELLLGSVRLPQWSVPGTASVTMDFHIAP
jgi:hypothetical protein